MAWGWPGDMGGRPGDMGPLAAVQHQSVLCGLSPATAARHEQCGVIPAQDTAAAALGSGGGCGGTRHPLPLAAHAGPRSEGPRTEGRPAQTQAPSRCCLSLPRPQLVLPVEDLALGGFSCTSLPHLLFSLIQRILETLWLSSACAIM